MQNFDTLDTVIRTTAAFIFGYFISAGFQGASNQSAGKLQSALPLTRMNLGNQPRGLPCFFGVVVSGLLFLLLVSFLGTKKDISSLQR